MAPTAPKKRSSIRAKTSKPTPSTSPSVHLPATHRKGALLSDGFLSSKADKRLIKHSAFVNRIEKAPHKAAKRRRPSKKLVTTLETLADALPDAGTGDGEVRAVVGEATIRHKSMKSRPGATKRREKLERRERERFGRNMAQMMGGAGVAENAGEEAGKEATRRRWGALRGFIEQTLEKKPEFVGK